MFHGEYVHAIDEKSRITLPARFRPALAGGVVLTRGMEKNVDVYPREGWDERMARIARDRATCWLPSATSRRSGTMTPRRSSTGSAVVAAASAER